MREWIKIDWHHHTFEDTKNTTRTAELCDSERMIEEFYNIGGRVMVITNHNTTSKKSIRQYEKIASSRFPDLCVLPGIELEAISPITKKLVHIIYIYKNKNDEFLDKVEVFADEMKKQVENGKLHIRNLIEKAHSFFGNEHYICMPHWNKDASADYQAIGEKDFSTVIQYYDALEARWGTEKRNSVLEKSVEFLPSNNNPIVLGTDAITLDEYLKNIKKLNFYLTEASFEGLIKIINYPEYRISNLARTNAGEDIVTRPGIVGDFIKSIEYQQDGKVESFNLDIGLNSIVGRRGTGKSTLVNSIAKKMKLPNFDTKISTFDLTIKTSSGREITSSNIKYLRQNELSSSITQSLVRNESFTIDFVGKIANINDFKLHDISNKYSIVKENVCNLIYENLRLVQNKNDVRTAAHKSGILNEIKEKVSKVSNDYAFKYYEHDKKILEQILGNKHISPWLQNEIKIIFAKLNKIDIAKISNNTNVELLIELINSVIQQNSVDDANSNLIGKIQELQKGIVEDLLFINDCIDNMNTIFQNIIDFYYKYNLNSEFISSAHETYKFITITNYVSIKECDDIYSFIVKCLSYKYSGITKIDGKKILREIFENKFNYATKTSLSTMATVEEWFNKKVSYKIGNTDLDEISVGTKHAMFLEQFLRELPDIVILDQPDDDLDSLTIEENIISLIKKNYATKQWIIITHDPKIAINADSSKIILANYSKLPPEKRDIEFGAINYSNVNSETLRKSVFKILDAKKEYPNIRFKEYGGYDGNK